MATFLVLYGTLTALLCALAIRQQFQTRTRAGPKLPPGPRKLPIVGNLMHLPPTGMPDHQHWLKHKEKYGPISSVSVMGTKMIMLHDKEAAHVILNKKSGQTWARPGMEFAYSVCGFDQTLVGQRCSETHRQHRKMVIHQLGSQAKVAEFDDIQDVEARRFLLRLLDEPQHLFKHVKTLTSSIILKLLYGYDIKLHELDPLIRLIEDATAGFVAASVPMSWMVDFFPFLNRLPDWFPGTGFKERARRCRETKQAMADITFSFVKEQMAKGIHRPSYVSRVLQENIGDYSDDSIKWTAASLCIGGLHTQSTTLSIFILAMLMFPDAQRRAQQEIDEVVGTDRLPTFDDRERLPFVGCVVKEVYRWAPVLPMGVTHASEDNTTYKGHLIPKGALLAPALWGFCQDPETYKDPECFSPERYLEPRNEPDPTSVTFGFGRRICPGRYLADANIFFAVAQTLACFDLRKAVKDGVELCVKLEFTPGLAMQPQECPYSIAPRSDKHAAWIRAINKEHPLRAGDAHIVKDARVEA